MRKCFAIVSCALAVVLSTAASVHAGFAGQIILGPIGPGSFENGDTTGHGDENDGWTSGDHFFDFWNGPDDVWQINWPGGDMEIEMTYDPFFGDLDVFLFEPGSLDESSNYGVQDDGIENISAPGSAAGTYYVNIDGYDGAAGAYTLSVTLVPEPATLSLLALGGALLIRRRR